MECRHLRIFPSGFWFRPWSSTKVQSIPNARTVRVLSYIYNMFAESGERIHKKLEGHLRRQPWKQGIERERTTGNGLEPLHPFWWPKYQPATRSLFTTMALWTSAGILPELMTKTYKNSGSVKVYVPPLGDTPFQTVCASPLENWGA